MSAKFRSYYRRVKETGNRAQRSTWKWSTGSRGHATHSRKW